jgi:nucleoside-diphosphate-sugar epimerase
MTSTLESEMQYKSGEYYCTVFHSIYDLKTVSLRYFNVYGPKQDPTSEYAAVIPKFMTNARNGKAPLIYGDGEQTRDFTFIKDVVQANIQAALSKKSRRRNNEHLRRKKNHDKRAGGNNNRDV